MNICFVILHYKDYRVTGQCVSSILSMDEGESCQIVIVDNDVHEPEEARSYLSASYKEYPNIHVLKVKKDLGFSYANNLGYRYARKKLQADCIIVANNDITFVQKDFISRLKRLEGDSADIISPDVIRESDGKHQSPIDTELRSRKQILNTIRFNRFCLRHYDLLYPVLYYVMKWLDRKPARGKELFIRRQKDIVPFGACILYMKSFVSREDKAFTPETRFYYEEYILARRCREKGYRIDYIPDLMVYHESGKSTRTGFRSEKKRIRFVMENTLRSAKRYLMTDGTPDRPKKKILYFMSVDWNWIAQRPHYLALALEQYYDVTVVYPRFLIRYWKAQTSTPKPSRCYGVPQIPFQERVRPLRRIGDRIFSHYMGDVHAYDIIWLGTPLFARFIPDDYKGPVVYDYMDDIVALQKSPAVAKVMEEGHRRLVERADYIFTTSNYLKAKLGCADSDKVHLIRNGFEHEEIYPPCQQAAHGEKIRFGYVGTIAEWIDFPTLLHSLDLFPKLEYHFWGPVGTKVPKHDRIILHGIIEHSEIYNHIKEMDCMIVPFIVNDIILAVDPVKIYEYISYGKNILCSDYPEVRHFGKFVHYYQDKASYAALVRQLIADGFRVNYTSEEQKSYLENCSWQARADQAYLIMDGRK